MASPTVLIDGLTFPEGPRWRDDRFWVSDFFTHRVISLSLTGDVRDEVVLADERPSGIGWLPDGRLLVVAMTSRRVLRQEADGSLAVHADLSALATYHCNDMVVDEAGRAYVGNFGSDIEDFLGEYGFHGLLDEPRFPAAAICLVQPDGTASWAANQLAFPNGTVITPDGSTLIVGETFGARLTAFSRNDDGTLTDRRVWADLSTGELPVGPDGICLDAEGGIWIADVVSGAALRVVEGGEVTDRVEASQNVFACMLGGPDRRHLLLCTAPSSDPSIAPGARSGRLEIAEVAIPGVGRP